MATRLACTLAVVMGCEALAATHHSCPPPEVTHVSAGGVQIDLEAHAVVSGALHMGVDNDAKLENIPAFLRASGTYYYQPTHPIFQGSHFKLNCPSGCSDGCTFYILMYHCPPCSSPTNGGWMRMLENDWGAAQCGANLLINGHGADAETHLHPTILMRKVMDVAGTYETIASDKYTKYLGVFAVSNKFAEPWCASAGGAGVPASESAPSTSSGPAGCLSECVAAV